MKAETMNIKIVMAFFCLVFAGCTANPTQEQPPATSSVPDEETDKVQVEMSAARNEEIITQESPPSADSYTMKRKEPTPTYQGSRPLEYQLATIDKGYVPDNDPTIARFRSLLEQLSNKYIENEQSIADMTVMAQKLLREKYGISESLLTIMEGMNRVLYQRIPNQQYAEYTTVYVQLRNSGMSHNEAVEGLAALIRTLSGK